MINAFVDRVTRSLSSFRFIHLSTSLFTLMFWILFIIGVFVLIFVFYWIFFVCVLGVWICFFSRFLSYFLIVFQVVFFLYFKYSFPAVSLFPYSPSSKDLWPVCLSVCLCFCSYEIPFSSLSLLLPTSISSFFPSHPSYFRVDEHYLAHLSCRVSAPHSPSLNSVPLPPRIFPLSSSELSFLLPFIPISFPFSLFLFPIFFFPFPFPSPLSSPSYPIPSPFSLLLVPLLTPFSPFLFPLPPSSPLLIPFPFFPFPQPSSLNSPSYSLPSNFFLRISFSFALPSSQPISRPPQPFSSSSFPLSSKLRIRIFFFSNITSERLFSSRAKSPLDEPRSYLAGARDPAR